MKMGRDEIVSLVKSSNDGIHQYLGIMVAVHNVDVRTDKDFQKCFNRFYRIRQRPQKWYLAYYDFLEKRKLDPPRFEEVLNYLHASLGRYEPSFSSKLVATLDPSQPL